MKKLYITLALIVIGYLSHAQNSDIYFKAMRDELSRSMDKLKIKDMPSPFIIQYTIAEADMLSINGKDGVIIKSNKKRYLMPKVRVLVGNYQFNNEMRGNHQNAAYSLLPQDGDYDQIRAALWKATDIAYKNSIQSYIHKGYTIKQLNLPKEDIEIADMSKIDSITYIEKERNNEIDLKKWNSFTLGLIKTLEKRVELYDYNVTVDGYSAVVNSHSSENVNLIYNKSKFTVSISATVVGNNQIAYSDILDINVESFDDLPTANAIKDKLNHFVNNIEASSKAKPISESYFGPIILESSALSNFINNNLTNYFIATKSTPGEQNAKIAEDRLQKRITAQGVEVVALPYTAQYNGFNLWGEFSIDNDGVRPEDSLLLLSDGRLTALLCNRNCTKKITQSNGYSLLNVEGNLSATISGGVLKVSSPDGVDNKTIKNRLIEAAKREGLTHAYRITKMNSGVVTEIYKIDVSNGNEELVQPSSINLSSASLRRITSLSSELVGHNEIFNGVPTSYILPYSMILEEVEIDKYEGSRIRPTTVEHPNRIEIK